MAPSHWTEKALINNLGIDVGFIARRSVLEQRLEITSQMRNENRNQTEKRPKC